MTQKDKTSRNLRGRAANWLTDRRRFLAGAGKYGALLMGAAYLPGQSPAGQDPTPPPPGMAEDGAAEKAVDQPVKTAVRVVGVGQRRQGLTRAEAPFADSPHIVPSYYALVYRDLTKKAPGREL